jgi:radical SAM protein with 4Fe4S-binding SPASM domain
MTVWNRVHVNTQGQCTPCCYATGGDLVLGNLKNQDFDEIWNGVTARDLRRGHNTWDYPSLCKTCMYTNLAGPERYLPFAGEVPGRLGRLPQGVEPRLEVTEPAHMSRSAEPPTFRVAAPREPVARWFVALALGGDADGLRLHEVQPFEDSDGSLALELPDGVWEDLETNLGHWWAIFAECAERPGRMMRSPEIRCLIRHEPIPRISDSNLRYPDQGHLAVVDLGGGKEAGWGGGHAPQARPRFGERRNNEWKSARSDDGSANGAATMSRADYLEMVQRVREVVAKALPAGSTVLVVSKGDDALLELDCRAAWHFPVGEDGGWAGFHPADDEWAIEHLESLRSCGADCLVIPTASNWWLERYEELAEHLVLHYPVVCDDEACVIFALGKYPAFYGRKRDAAVDRYLDGVTA